jgi:hypothetical protein
MAARTALNTILRDAAKRPLLRMTASIVSEVSDQADLISVL